LGRHHQWRWLAGGHPLPLPALEDIIRKDFAARRGEDHSHVSPPSEQRCLNGVVWRFHKAHWRFGLFVFIRCVDDVLADARALFGTLCMALVSQLGAPELVARAVGLITGARRLFRPARLSEPQT